MQALVVQSSLADTGYFNAVLHSRPLWVRLLIEFWKVEQTLQQVVKVRQD